MIFAEDGLFSPALFFALKFALNSPKPPTPDSVRGDEGLLWPITGYN